MTNIIKIEQEKQQLDYIRTLAKIATESKQYANMTESQLFNLMLSAKDLGISPLKGINGGFYIVNGKVCMSTALMADRIRKEGHSIKIIEMSKEKCVIIAKRKDNDDSLKLEYSMEDAVLAGIAGSMTWKKYPKNMLYNRCMSQVARILFPDVIGNSYSEEERFDIANVPAEKRPLESQDEEMVIDVVMEQAKLKEDQCAILDMLLQGEDEMKEKVEEYLQVKSLYEMDPKDFERIVTLIQKKKGLKPRLQEETA